MAEVFIQLLMESVSILAASAMLSLGGVAMAPGVPPNHRGIWSNAAIQVGLEPAPHALHVPVPVPSSKVYSTLLSLSAPPPV